jgi:hypothetical protein
MGARRNSAEQILGRLPGDLLIEMERDGKVRPRRDAEHRRDRFLEPATDRTGSAD